MMIWVSERVFLAIGSSQLMFRWYRKMSVHAQQDGPLRCRISRPRIPVPRELLSEIPSRSTILLAMETRPFRLRYLSGSWGAVERLLGIRDTPPGGLNSVGGDSMEGMLLPEDPSESKSGCAVKIPQFQLQYPECRYTAAGRSWPNMHTVHRERSHFRSGYLDGQSGYIGTHGLKMRP